MYNKKSSLMTESLSATHNGNRLMLSHGHMYLFDEWCVHRILQIY